MITFYSGILPMYVVCLSLKQVFIYSVNYALLLYRLLADHTSLIQDVTTQKEVTLLISIKSLRNLVLKRTAYLANKGAMKQGERERAACPTKGTQSLTIGLTHTRLRPSTGDNPIEHTVGRFSLTETGDNPIEQIIGRFSFTETRLDSVKLPIN